MKYKHLVVVDPIHGIEESIHERISTISEKLTAYDTYSLDEDELINRISDADAILVHFKTKVTSRVVDECQNLKYIGLVATSHTSINVKNTSRDVVVSNIPSYGDEAPSEWIFLQLLRMARGYADVVWHPESRELHGMTIGIIGLGIVGKFVANAALGFGMHVLYYSKTRKQEWESKGLVYSNKEDLLQRSDVISLHTPRDVKILSANDFDIMNGKVLVNTTLGEAFNKEDFLTWIKKENNFAIMDGGVSENYHKTFLKEPKALMFKEISGKTLESQIRLQNQVVANLQAFLTGKPINIVSLVKMNEC